MVIGIDLGTTFSCVGVIQNGEVQIVTNLEGHRITSSCVSYRGDEIIVGDAAKEEAEVYPESTIFGAKRLIGRSWSDEVVQEDIRLWPFQVRNDNGRPKYLIRDDETEQTFFPEDVSAQILIKMKTMAEDYLGEDIKEAVITVPAYFNENQKRATRDAARIAGLEVLDLLTEPNAAAIAYGVDLQEDAERLVLIFDFGGGTFDVSILSIKNCDFNVLAIGGDAHLGGEDIDYELALYFEKNFNEKHGTQLREDNKKAWRRLKARCEKLKIQLSNTLIANIKLDSLHAGKDLTGSLTRARFEEINHALFRRTIDRVKDVLRDSKIDKDRIHDVILVGGSTRIPKIKKLLNECLERDTPLVASVNVDEAVALGATILAAVKSNTRLIRIPHVKLWDALPQSLGIGTSRGTMHTFIPRNTRVPVTETMILSTDRDNQNLLRFKVYEGESTDVNNNFFLGEFRIAGIPPAPRGVPLIEITFTVNDDCLLEVTARDLTTKRQKGFKIQHDTKRLSEEELQELVARAERFSGHTKEIKARIQALKELEDYARDIRTSCLREPLKSRVPETILDEIQSIYTWIDNCHELGEHPGVEESAEKKKDLENIWNPIITEIYTAKQKPGPPTLYQD